jgi:DNA recombination protein RmuC
MPDIWILVVLAALVVVVVLIALALSKLAVLAAKSDDFERDVKQDLANARAEQTTAARNAREELGGALSRQGGAQNEQLKHFGERLAELTKSNDARLEAVRATVEQKLDALRVDNAQKLEQMRATVDEKLQTTLDQRLGASFKLVSERLEQVHKGLGDMQNLAVGVGDLKRVLTNVKTRGTWGEVQLAALLAEVLTPQQFGTNVETVPGTGKRVEFAIRLPGRGDDGKPCWLPVDAKFPLDDWQRLQDALERADAPAAELARKSLADFLRLQAKTIHDSYVAPPHTTDFAILFVPTEGLYAEMMSRPGFAEALQRDYRVTLTGPTNFMALLNSLQMGFRTLVIEQRSSEVWKVLGAVKSEFGKFGAVLAKTKERIDKAGEELEKAGVRSRAIARELRSVEALPAPEAARLIGVTLDEGAADASAAADQSKAHESRDGG